MGAETKETKSRSLTKAVSYRCVGVLGTMTIVFLFTGELWLSTGIGIADLVAGVVLYYVHERVWNIIEWNKKSE